jgi:cyclic beta-1,2-glucan synthetase
LAQAALQSTAAAWPSTAAVKPFTGARLPTPAGPFFRAWKKISRLCEWRVTTLRVSRRGHYVTPAAQWLLDNFHLIQASANRGGVSQRYYADLPKLAERPLRTAAGLCRVTHCPHRQRIGRRASFLHAYQEVSDDTGELWALPGALKTCAVRQDRLEQGGA